MKAPVWSLKERKTHTAETIDGLVILCLYSGSSVWMKPETSGWSQNPERHLNKINTTTSADSKRRSTAVTNQGSCCETASSSLIPTVTFDLGNEWDDWGDFDEENLVHASETSIASCTVNAKPQIQQSVQYNMPGRVKTEFHLQYLWR